MKAPAVLLMILIGFGANRAEGKCPLAYVELRGSISQERANDTESTDFQIETKLLPDPSSTERTLTVHGRDFTITMGFDTFSGRRWFSDRCARRPEKVITTLLLGNRKICEVTLAIETDFQHDPESGDYRIRQPVRLNPGS